MTSTDFDNGVGIDNSLKTDDHLTAFSLALMQNGFATPNSILNSHTFQQISKQNHTNLASSNILASSSIQAQTSSTPTETAQEKCASSQRANELNTWNSKSESYQPSQKHFKYAYEP